MYPLALLSMAIAALITLAKADPTSYFELSHIATHSPSGRSQPANNELYFRIVDPVTGTNGTCSVEWNYKEEAPMYWVPCSDVTLSVQYDYYNSLQDFQIEVQHVYGGENDQCSDKDFGDCVVSRATATFVRADPKWRLNCGGSGVCNASYMNSYCAAIENQ